MSGSGDMVNSNAELVTRACPVCGASQFSSRWEVPAEDFTASRTGVARARIVRCAGCGVDYTNPILSPEAGSRVYLDADSGYNSSQATTPEETVWIDQTICFAAIKEHCKLGEKILDFGCGEGGFVHLCREAGFEASGIELNSEAVKRATSLGIQGICCKPLSELSPETYNLIAAIHVLEHLDDLRPIVGAFCRLLRPAGKVIIMVPNYRSFKMTIRPMRYWDNPYIHINGLSAAKLDLLFHQFGFQRIALRQSWGTLGQVSCKDRISMLLTKALGNGFNLYPTKLLVLYQWNAMVNKELELW